MSTLPSFECIVVAADESPNAMHAVEVAARLSVALEARLVVLHVVDMRAAILPEVGIASEQILAGLRDAGAAIINTARARVSKVDQKLCERSEFLSVEGVVPEEIVGVAQTKQAGMIVVGTHGRTGLARLLMGSTAENVLRHAGRPVLAVPLGKS